MTISTYTEPQPVNIAVDDSPQLQEIEEDVEEGSFAELLAGLMQKSGIDGESEILSEALSGEQESIQLYAMKDTDRIAVFDNPQAGEFLEKDFTEKDFSEPEIPQEEAGFLLSAEHLLTRSTIQENGGEETSVDFLQDMPEVQTQDFRLADGHDAELQSLKTDMEVSEPVADAGMELTAQTAAAQKQETPSVDNDGKKERAFAKDAKVETRPDTGRSEETASLRKEPEKAGLGKLDEARSRRRDKVAVDVRDQRTAVSMSNNTEMRVSANAETVSGRTAQTGDAPVREMTLELRLPEGQSQQAQTTWEVKSGNALENMLARELHQNFNGDIVRHASMALRDGGQATIRLALKPDTLGNVKIQLELTENKITGRIVVESEEAFNAFRKEIASLEQAFRESGFTNADLNLSLAAESRNAQGQEQETDSWAHRNAASRYDSSLDGGDQDALTVDVFFGHRPGSINMFA